MGPKFFIVIPVYEDRESAAQLMRAISSSCPVPPYIIAVEDGSIRGPLRAEDISRAGLAGEILFLTRNMGHQRAIATGLGYIAFNFEPDFVVVMDADGEDRPEAIAELVAQLQKGDVDAVVAQRRKRSESLQFRTFYLLYRQFFYVLTGRTIRFGNFTALSGLAVRRLASMQETWVHLAASLMVSRLRIGAVPTDRGKRYAGHSSMNFVSLILHGMRSLMVFAEDVLVRVGVICCILASGAIVLLGVAVVLKLIGFATPGWFSTAIGILVLILLQSGILTFATLMVAGVVKSAPPITRAAVDQLIERREVVRPDAAAMPELSHAAS